MDKTSGIASEQEKHLKGLTKLRRLELTGGWASAAEVNKLRKTLPDCIIDTTSEPEE